jgi:hypothetical protein
MLEKKTLTGIFIGAALGLATGFATEFFTFPFFHNSIPGQYLATIGNELLLPLYNGVGMALGMNVPTTAVAGIPTVGFG